MTDTSAPGLKADATDEVPHLEQRTLRVDVEGLPTLVALEERYENKVVFSRVMRGDVPGHPGTVDVASAELTPAVGDILTVVGDAEVVERVVRDLGHPSSVPLVLDRSQLDFRRITVSDRKVAGRSLEQLRLPARFGATATRVRRGDVDLLATDDLVLQLGDRVRVVARREEMAQVAAFLGDSERGASDLNPVGLALGMSLGLLAGLLTLPMPRGGTFALGVAGGPLLVGLLLGRVQRTGRILWTIPLPGLRCREPAGDAAVPRVRGLERGPRSVERAGDGPGPAPARGRHRRDRADRGADAVRGTAAGGGLRSAAGRRSWPGSGPSPLCWRTRTSVPTPTRGSTSGTHWSTRSR